MIIKFEFEHNESGTIKTACPHGRGNNGSIFGYQATRVASVSCQVCPAFESRDLEKQVVVCNHRKPLVMADYFFSAKDTAIVRNDDEIISGTSDINFARGFSPTLLIFNLKSWGSQGWQVAI